MRRRFKFSSEDPIKKRPVGTSLNQGSDNLLDMKKYKRVKFADPKMDNLPNDKQDVSSRKYNATHLSKSDASKTSEYAYFKKLKNNAGCSHSHALHREDRSRGSSEFNDHSRETKNASATVSTRTNDVSFTFPGEKSGPTDNTLFLSPRGSKYNNLSQLRSKDIVNDVKPVDQNLFTSPFKGVPGNSESQCTEKGVFSAKRQKLLQCVADASSCEIEELHSKGFDLVSSLLSRLFPKGNENDDSIPSKCGRDNNSKPPTFWESDDEENGIHVAYKREWDKLPPENYSGRSRGIVPSKWNPPVPLFLPSKYKREIQFGDESIDLDFSSESNTITSSYTEQESLFCLPIERYVSAGSCHLKETDAISCPIDYSGEVLGGDIQRKEDKVDSPIINHVVSKKFGPRLATSKNADHQKDLDYILDAKPLCLSSLCSKYYVDSDSLPNNNSSRLATSWGVDHGKGMDDAVDAKALCSSSICSKYHLDLDSLPTYFSTNIRTWDFGLNRKNKCALEETDLLPLALPCAPTYFETQDIRALDLGLASQNVCALADWNLFSVAFPCIAKHIETEGCGTKEFLESSKFTFSHHDTHHGDFELLLPRGLNFDFQFKCSSTKDFFAGDHQWHSPYIQSSTHSMEQMEEHPEETLNFFYEGAFPTHSGSSTFQCCVDKLTSGYPLLLDSVSHDRSDTIFDDDNNLKYG